MNLEAALLIPAEVRFDCTFCGNCCLSWPVPVTAGDIEKIEQHLAGNGRELPLSRVSEKEAGKVKAFTHALSKRPDGRCSFLSDEERCELHDSAKPSMCRLFPYTFFASPEGLRVGLSFASSGVLRNSGRLLSEQEESLRALSRLFASLYGELAVIPKAPSHVKLCHEFEIEYEQFLLMEEALLADLLASLRNGGLVMSVLSEHYQKSLARVSNLGEPQFLCGSHSDWCLLETYSAAFLGKGRDLRLLQEDEISARMASHLERTKDSPAQAALNISLYDLTFNGPGALKHKLVLPVAVENLLLRFAYVRIFARLYFAEGFSSLSFAAGLGHLALLICTVRLSLYAFIESQRGTFFEQEEEVVAEAMKLLSIVDRKWTALSYSRNGRSMLELAFLDPERLRRLRSLL